jgi:hypothetical protein
MTRIPWSFSTSTAPRLTTAEHHRRRRVHRVHNRQGRATSLRQIDRGSQCNRRCYREVYRRHDPLWRHAYRFPHSSWDDDYWNRGESTQPPRDRGAAPEAGRPVIAADDDQAGASELRIGWYRAIEPASERDDSEQDSFAVSQRPQRLSLQASLSLARSPSADPKYKNLYTGKLDPDAGQSAHLARQLAA